LAAGVCPSPRRSPRGFPGGGGCSSRCRSPPPRPPLQRGGPSTPRSPARPPSRRTWYPPPSAAGSVQEPARPPGLHLELGQLLVHQEIHLQAAALAEGQEAGPPGPLVPGLLRAADAEPEQLRRRTPAAGAGAGTGEMQLLGHLDGGPVHDGIDAVDVLLGVG